MIEITEEERLEISYALYRQFSEKERLRGVIKDYEKGSDAVRNIELSLAKHEGMFLGMIRMLKTFGFAVKQVKDDSTGETNFHVGVVAPFAKAHGSTR